MVALAWIIDFPFYEWDDHGKKLDFGHNPFGMPKGGLKALESATTDTEKLAIVADQFDMVMNGYEICSGGVRNHNPAVLYKVFDLLGFSESYVEEKFGATLISTFLVMLLIGGCVWFAGPVIGIIFYGWEPEVSRE